MRNIWEIFDKSLRNIWRCAHSVVPILRRMREKYFRVWFWSETVFSEKGNLERSWKFGNQTFVNAILIWLKFCAKIKEKSQTIFGADRKMLQMGFCVILAFHVANLKYFKSQIWNIFESKFKYFFDKCEEEKYINKKYYWEYFLITLLWQV